MIFEESDADGLDLVRTIQLRGDIPWREVERSAFGYTALDLSVALVRAWRLPQPLIEGANQRPWPWGHVTASPAPCETPCLPSVPSTSPRRPGRRQELTPGVAGLIDRYYEGPEGLRRWVNALLESATIAPA